MSNIIENNFPLVDPENATHIHFGIFPDNEDIAPYIQGEAGREHSSTSEEEMLWRSPGLTAWVSGSWECWGPADQATEGGSSLHVVIFMYDMPSEELLQDIHQALAVSTPESRVLEHGYITTNDHSEIFSAFTIDRDQVSLMSPIRSTRLMRKPPMTQYGRMSKQARRIRRIYQDDEN